jgi:hypothetical protein
MMTIEQTEKLSDILMHLEYQNASNLYGTLLQSEAQIKAGIKSDPHNLSLRGTLQRIQNDIEILRPFVTEQNAEINKRLNNKINALKPFKFIPVKVEEK